jgi:HK97 gp10 family phage protein
MIRFELKNEKEFERKLDRLKIRHGKRLNDIVHDSTTKMHRYAVHKAPVDDGKLRQGITMDFQRGGRPQGSVISNAKYSAAVEEGTKPHTIRVRYKKVLAGPKRKAPSGWNNFSRDWAIYGKKVKHPGTDPQPFVKPAFDVGRKYMIRQIKKMFK